MRRFLTRFWRWLRTKPGDTVSERWLNEHVGTSYEDNPLARREWRRRQ